VSDAKKVLDDFIGAFVRTLKKEREAIFDRDGAFEAAIVDAKRNTLDMIVDALESAHVEMAAFDIEIQATNKWNHKAVAVLKLSVLPTEHKFRVRNKADMQIVAIVERQGLRKLAVVDEWECSGCQYDFDKKKLIELLLGDIDRLCMKVK
jgi:hypothetical protein